MATADYWPQWFGDAIWPPVTLGLLGIIVAAGSAEIGERHIASRREFFIRQTFEPHWQTLKTHDEHVRLNVMVMGWRSLKVAERFGFSQSHRDSQLRIARRCGIAGLAVENQAWTMGIRIDEMAVGKPTDRCYVLSESGQVKQNGVPIRDIDHGLTSTQRDETSRLKFILSYPFRGLETENGSVKNTGKVIGVVNLDSSDVTPYVTRDPATGKIVAFTPLCTQIINELLPRLATVAGWVFG